MRNWPALGLITAGFVLLCATGAHAQQSTQRPQPPKPSVTGYLGACVAVVTLPSANADRDMEVVLRLNGRPSDDSTLKKGTKEIEMKVGRRLVKGDDLQAVVLDGDSRSESEETPATVAPKGTNISDEACPADANGRPWDEREVLEVIAYGGMAIDTFAPAKLGNYVDAANSKTTTRQRAIAGIDFAYRLTKRTRPVQFWIAGETLYGARTADFCKDEDEDKCFKESTEPGAFARILRSASSFEAYITPRLEFWTFQKESDAPLALYGTGRLGLIALDGTPGIAGAHHVGIGTTVTGGRYEGTLVEVGWGKTDLFLENQGGKSKWNRLKIDALVAIGLTDKTYAFVQLYIDTTLRRDDVSSGLQTFIGLERNLTSFKFW